MAVADRLLRCPQCNAMFAATPKAAWKPFCSARCKEIDLGDWLDGSYAIPDDGQSEDSRPESNPAQSEYPLAD